MIINDCVGLCHLNCESIHDIYHIAVLLFFDPPCFDDSDIYPWSCLGQPFIIFVKQAIACSILYCSPPNRYIAILFSAFPYPTIAIQYFALPLQYRTMPSLH